MKRILFFCCEYWGHLSLCLGLANQLRKAGNECVFGFIFPPAPTIIREIHANGHKCLFELSNITEYTLCKSYNEKIDFEDEARKRLIDIVSPQFTIVDSVDFSICALKTLTCPFYKIVRTNLQESVYRPIYEFYKKKYYNGRNIAWSEMVNSNKNIVPHAPEFLRINNQATTYFRPSWGKLKDVQELQGEQYDVICVLSTAIECSDLLEKLVSVLSKFEYTVLICNSYASHKLCWGKITVVPWANLDGLIEHAKIVIHTGGHGSIMRSIMSRTPQIIVDIGADFIPAYAKQIKTTGIGEYVCADNNALGDTITTITKNYQNYQRNTDCLHDKFMELPLICDIL